MGKALELVSFYDLDAPAAFAAMTNATGNSNVVRNASANSKIFLLTCWGTATGQAILVRIRSPLMHDNQQALRFQIPVDNQGVLLDPNVPQQLFPQDALLVESQSVVADAATNVHLFSMLLYYEDLPGISANLISPDYLKANYVALMNSENTISTAATGDYGGEVAINATLDQFKANTYYALLGYWPSLEAGSVRYRGVDTGNLGVGGPAEIDDPFFSSRFFIWLSERSGKACIPAFNSANRAAVLVDATQDEGGADPIVTSFFAQLRGSTLV